MWELIHSFSKLFQRFLKCEKSWLFGTVHVFEKNHDFFRLKDFHEITRHRTRFECTLFIRGKGERGLMWREFNLLVTCWCVDVLMCGCVDVLMCWVLCWCVECCLDVLMSWFLMRWCVDALMCWCVVDVLMCWCVDVLMYWCVDVLMCWYCWYCWYCWCVCVDVLMTVVLMCWWLCWCRLMCWWVMSRAD